MVLDFNELKPIQKFLDRTVDHRLLLDIDDPLLQHWLECEDLSLDDLIYDSEMDGWSLSAVVVMARPTYLREWFSSWVVFDFPPTSEHLAQWLYNRLPRILLPETLIGIQWKTIWHESSKSCAEFDGS
jgi:6-pyruvoyltetrahydropterin/6-carboxytetrahydropterin synthase